MYSNQWRCWTWDNAHRAGGGGEGGGIGGGIYSDLRDFKRSKQIAAATPTTAVVDAEVWGQYVTAARQISTLRKRHQNRD